MKSRDFLEAVRAKHGGCSDYRIAKVLGINPSTMSRYMAGNLIGDDVALRVADELDLDPAYVIGCVNAERVSDPALRKVWTHIAELGRRSAAVAIIGIVGMTGFLAPSPAPASTPNDVYYVK